MELLAILAAFAASLTGIITVGCGHRFCYTPKQLAKGDPIALVYVMLCSTVIVSAFQATFLFDAAARGGQQYGLFPLAASISGSLLFVAVHVAAGKWVDQRNGVST